LLESGEDSLFVFCSDVAMSTEEEVIDDEWKGWRMCQQVCYRWAKCTNGVKTQEGCSPRYEVSPSLANMCESVPPMLAVPSPSRDDTDTDVVEILVFVCHDNSRPIEIKYIKYRIVVEDENRCST
jgi:hypothetical protein